MRYDLQVWVYKDPFTAIHRTIDFDGRAYFMMEYAARRIADILRLMIDDDYIYEYRITINDHEEQKTIYDDKLYR